MARDRARDPGRVHGGYVRNLAECAVFLGRKAVCFQVREVLEVLEELKEIASTWVDPRT